MLYSRLFTSRGRPPAPSPRPRLWGPGPVLPAPRGGRGWGDGSAPLQGCLLYIHLRLVCFYSAVTENKHIFRNYLKYLNRPHGETATYYTKPRRKISVFLHPSTNRLDAHRIPQFVTRLFFCMKIVTKENALRKVPNHFENGGRVFKLQALMVATEKFGMIG